MIDQLRLAQRTQRRLQAIRQALPLVIERSRIDGELAKLTNSARLSADFRDRYRELAGNRLHLQQRVRSLSEARNNLEEKRQSIHLDEQVLHGADDIESLRHDWGAIEKAARDRIELLAEANQLAERSRQIQRETVGEEVPTWSGRDLQIVEELCRRFAELQKRQEYLGEKHAGIESRRQRAIQEREAIGPAIDDRGVVDGLREAEEWGNVDSALDDLDGLSASTREQIDRGRSSIGLEEMDLDQLARSAWPSDELVNHYDTEFQEVKLHRSEVATKLDECESALDQLLREIRQATVGRALPTLEDLREARALRDDLWRTTRQKVEVEQFPSRQDLDQFEESYRQSDSLADRLRDEADQVARLARLEIERSSLEDQIRRGKEKLAEADAAQRDLESRWRELWGATGVTVHPPRAMLAVLRVTSEIISATRKLREIDNQRRRAAEKRETLLESLSRAFVGEQAPARLIDAIRLARQWVDENARRSTKREHVEKVLSDIDRESKELEAEQRRWEESQRNGGPNGIRRVVG